MRLALEPQAVLPVPTVKNGRISPTRKLDPPPPLAHTTPLTTPVSYITSVHLKDPFLVPGQTFRVRTEVDYDGTFMWINYADTWATSVHTSIAPRSAWIVASHGPSKQWSFIEHYPYELTWDPDYSEPQDGYPDYAPDMLYDATNGTMSFGGIARLGGAVPAQTP